MRLTNDLRLVAHCCAPETRLRENPGIVLIPASGLLALKFNIRITEKVDPNIVIILSIPTMAEY